MSFLISATDTCGRVMLRRETPEAAFKKAAELAADGYRDIAITGPEGRLYAPRAFDRASSEWLSCAVRLNGMPTAETYLYRSPIEYAEMTL